MSHVVFKSYVSHVFNTTNLDFFVTSLTISNSGLAV